MFPLDLVKFCQSYSERRSLKGVVERTDITISIVAQRHKSQTVIKIRLITRYTVFHISIKTHSNHIHH